MLCSQLAASTKDTNQPADVTAGGPLRSCFLPRVTCSVASGDATAAAAARVIHRKLMQTQNGSIFLSQLFFLSPFRTRYFPTAA